jgi:hypothetical protein
VAKAPVALPLGEQESRASSKSVPAASKSGAVESKASGLAPVAADIVGRSKAIVGAVLSAASVVPRDRRTLSIAAVAVGIVIAALVGVTMLSGPAPTGTVVIDAAPWGTITAIETDGGDPVALPPSPSTPLSLTLPAGRYQVSVAGPSADSPAQRITVEVRADASTVAPLIRFQALTPGEYFEEYLSAPTASTLDASVELETPTQSSPVPPAATVGNP